MADRYDECDDREQIFVARYVDTWDARRAALDAGYTLATARSIAYQWVKDPGCKPHVYDSIQHRKAEKLKKFEVEANEVRSIVWEAATADPTELIEFRRTCCRWCWGEGFRYQWTQSELAAAVKAAQKMGLALPEMEGGVGYDAKRDPNPDCPECFGEGVETVRAKDSRDLSPGARRIFKGVKKTASGGFEIVTQDQTAYLKLFAELCGMTVKKLEATGKDGAPLVSIPTVIQLVAGDGSEGEDDE